MTSLPILPLLATLVGAAPAADEPSAEPPPSATPDQAASDRDVADQDAPDQDVADQAAPDEDDPADDEAEPAAATPDANVADSPAAGENAQAASLAVKTLPPATATPAPPPPPVVRPIRWRLDFGLGAGSTLVGDLGYRAFAPRRHLPEGSVTVMADFRLAESRLFLGGGLAYQRLGRTHSVYDQIYTDLSIHEPEVLGRVSVRLVEGLDVYGRLGVGPSIVDLGLNSQQNSSQRAIIPRVDGQGGLSLYLPRAWLRRKQAARLSAGLNLGLGYTWRGKFEVRPEVVTDDEPLRTTSTPLGDLSLHGVSFRIGVFLRVM